MEAAAFASSPRTPLGRRRPASAASSRNKPLRSPAALPAAACCLLLALGSYYEDTAPLGLVLGAGATGDSAASHSSASRGDHLEYQLHEDASSSDRGHEGGGATETAGGGHSDSALLPQDEGMLLLEDPEEPADENVDWALAGGDGDEAAYKGKAKLFQQLKKHPLFTAAAALGLLALLAFGGLALKNVKGAATSSSDSEETPWEAFQPHPAVYETLIAERTPPEP